MVLIPRSCARVLVGVLLALGVGAGGVSARAEPGQSQPGPAQQLPRAIEPEVAQAYLAALARFPEPIRTRLARVPFERHPAPEVPDDAPLVYHLMAAAAQGAYTTVPEAVIVYDAGLHPARWTRDLTGEADRELVAAFLEPLADVLGVAADDPEAQWRAFAQCVAGWAGPAEPRGFDAEPPMGCPRVFEAFIRRGVRRALGIDTEGLDLESLIVHEMAHAVQLRDGAFDARQHMLAWGTMAGWTRCQDHARFDGYHSGMFRLEAPEVLVRLMIAGDPSDPTSDPSWRGPSALYEHHPLARFVNLYASYDAREDFAESVRLFVMDPDRLLEVSPERFAFINAIGWCDRLDLASPGPLWRGAEEIIERGWQATIEEALAAMLAPAFGARWPDLRVLAALVRSHEALLDPARLPPPNEPFALPPDLPRAILREHDVALLTPVVTGVGGGGGLGGVAYPPPRERLMNEAMRELLKWWELSDFYRSLAQLLRPGEPEIESIRAEFVALATMNSNRREAQALILAEDASLWAADPRLMREVVAAEAEHHRANGERLLAERLLLSITLHDPMLSDADRSAEIERIERLARAAPLGEHTVELLAGIVRHRSAELGPEGVVEMVQTIPGATLGSIRRIELLFDAANRIAERSGAEGLDPLWAAMVQEYKHGEHFTVRNFAKAMIPASMHHVLSRVQQSRDMETTGDESPSPSDQEEQP